MNTGQNALPGDNQLESPRLFLFLAFFTFALGRSLLLRLRLAAEQPGEIAYVLMLYVNTAADSMLLGNEEVKCAGV